VQSKLVPPVLNKIDLQTGRNYDLKKINSNCNLLTNLYGIPNMLLIFRIRKYMI